MDDLLPKLAYRILNEAPVLWTFILLLTRFGAMFGTIPGIGGGLTGVAIRYPAAVVLAVVSVTISQQAVIPPNMVMMAVAMFGEVMLGFLLGLIPLLIVNGVQLGGQLSATTMGLQASALIDPTTQTSVPDLARIFSDLSIILFLLLDGHHVIIYAASGYGGAFVPGTFLQNKDAVFVLIDRSQDLLQTGIMVAAPILVALLGTNLVMGLISKTVPTLNVFIVSFPLTIGIGLVLSSLMLPEIFEFTKGKFLELESTIDVLKGLR